MKRHSEGNEEKNMPVEPADGKTIKDAVKEKYAAIARGEMKGCCDGSKASSDVVYNISATSASYDSKKLAEVPEGANLGLGCGDPTADADLQSGQTVLDLGSGAGVDCFLASRRVGPSGRVIGVDMTDAMLNRARENAARGGFSNVEFRKGEIENLPVESGTIDRIISNCVINLAPDKSSVFREAYRVLKPGGAVTVSDIVSHGEIPAPIRADMEAWTGCIAGALDKAVYLEKLQASGFKNVTVLKEIAYDYLRGPDYGFASITVRAVK
jgi:arsenite methyltransferase